MTKIVVVVVVWRMYSFDFECVFDEVFVHNTAVVAVIVAVIDDADADAFYYERWWTNIS